MKGCIFIIFLILLLSACETTDNLIILSPSIPEEELKERVQESFDKSSQSKPKEESKTSKKIAAEANKVPAEPIPSSQEALALDEPLMGVEDTQKALIDLLVEKGIITQDEFIEELKKLRAKKIKK